MNPKKFLYNTTFLVQLPYIAFKFRDSHFCSWCQRDFFFKIFPLCIIIHNTLYQQFWQFLWKLSFHSITVHAKITNSNNTFLYADRTWETTLKIEAHVLNYCIYIFYILFYDNKLIYIWNVYLLEVVINWIFNVTHWTNQARF